MLADYIEENLLNNTDAYRVDDKTESITFVNLGGRIFTTDLDMIQLNIYEP